MRKVLILSLIFTSLFANAQKARIKLKINGLKNQTVHLAYYYEDKNYIAQTKHLDENGEAVFENDTLFLQGLYSIIVPDIMFLDIIMSEDQTFDIKTDTFDIPINTHISGSKDNKGFYDYQKEIFPINKEQEKLFDSVRSTNDTVIQSLLDKKMSENLAKSNKILEKYIEKYKGSFLSTLLNLSYSTHFVGKDRYKHINFSDERIIVTPFYYNVIRYVIAQNLDYKPEYINMALDTLINFSRANKRVYEYTVSYLLNFYRTFCRTGMNYVFIHLADNYFLNGKAYWLPQKSIDLIRKQRDIFDASSIGKQAHNIKILTTNGDSLDIYTLDAKLKLVYFWSSGCGHCTDATNRLKKYYANLKEKNIEIFAVNTDAQTMRDWEHIKEIKPMPWISGVDLEEKSRFREYYYVCSTPILYVLEGDTNKILYKAVGEDEIDEIVKRLVND